MKLAIGMGCDRDTAFATLHQALAEALAVIDAGHSDIDLFASIDKKSDEVALLQLARHYQRPLQFYTAAELAGVTVPNPSETVRRFMGTPAVSEAAALLAADADSRSLLLEKYKYRGADGKNATVSIAAIAPCDAGQQRRDSTTQHSKRETSL